MIKKLLKILFVTLIAFNSLSYAGAFSNLFTSGIFIYYASLESYIRGEQKILQNMWENEIGDILKQINEEARKKEELLKTLNALQQETAIKTQEINFLLEQEIYLLDNNANINAVR